MDKVMQEAVTVLLQGGIVIYPTDTAFGIGCRIDKPESVDRLFDLRRRPRSMAMPVLVDSIDRALAYFDHPGDIVRRLMKTYWPGALTIVSPCIADRVYSPIRGNGDTLGIRMPDHDTALALIAGVDVPILGSSANFHGKPTPFHLSDLDAALTRVVDYVVPGKCTNHVTSTVIDASRSPAVIVRQGAISLSEEELR